MFVLPVGNLKEIGQSPERLSADAQTGFSFGEMLSRESEKLEQRPASDDTAVNAVVPMNAPVSANQPTSPTALPTKPGEAFQPVQGQSFEAAAQTNDIVSAKTNFQNLPMDRSDTGLKSQPSSTAEATINAPAQAMATPARAEQANLATPNSAMSNSPAPSQGHLAAKTVTLGQGAPPPQSAKADLQAVQAKSTGPQIIPPQIMSGLMKSAEVVPPQTVTGQLPPRIGALKPADLTNGVGNKTGKAQSTTFSAPDLSKAMANSSVQTSVSVRPDQKTGDFSLLAPSSDGAAASETVSPEAEFDAPLPETQTALQRSEAVQPAQTRTTTSPQMAQIVSQTGQKLLERFDGKSSRFEIRLDPAELGKVDVRIRVDADGRIQAVLAAQDPTAADALTRGLRSLENALTQAGLSLSENGVQIELAGRERGRSSNNTNTFDGGSSSSGSGTDTDDVQDDLPRNMTPEIQVWSHARLDMRA
ncbi:MAG: hypothetical protein CMK09_09840 [Ponticaulis sp.]|nr:hypothetical protein [Ponticaulis sp.]|tara:strand:+ start:20574 stop:21998 length:1425 start_codon:yes stop_codon:yes gene_type:complete